MKTSFEDFLIEYQVLADLPDIRPGQAAYNALFTCNRELADKIHVTTMDPFYWREGTDMTWWWKEIQKVWDEERNYGIDRTIYLASENTRICCRSF